MLSFFFFKQKTAYEMRISDWSSDVCSSDLLVVAPHVRLFAEASDAERAAVAKLAVPGKVMIDLASDRLFDMSYTSGAEIYLGDVSSHRGCGHRRPAEAVGRGAGGHEIGRAHV